MLFRLRARGALEDRLEELGVGPMRTKITDEELENARARIADERARKVSVFPPKSVEHIYTLRRPVMREVLSTIIWVVPPACLGSR